MFFYWQAYQPAAAKIQIHLLVNSLRMLLYLNIINGILQKVLIIMEAKTMNRHEKICSNGKCYHDAYIFRTAWSNKTLCRAVDDHYR